MTKSQLMTRPIRRNRAGRTARMALVGAWATWLAGVSMTDSATAAEPPKSNTAKTAQQQLAPQEQRQDETYEERRDFELRPDKAELFHDLLAPEHVMVRVGQSDGGIYVIGTLRELEVLSAFAELLTRDEDLFAKDREQFKRNARMRGTTSETYRLTESTLYDLLVGEDVPVFVTKRGDRISVEAALADQKTIRQVVAILEGQRLHGGRAVGEPPTRRGQPGARGPREPGRESREAPRPRPDERQQPEKPDETGEFHERQQGLEMELRRLREDLEREAAELRERADQLRREAEHIRQRVTEEAERFKKELAQFGDSIKQKADEWRRGSDSRRPAPRASRPGAMVTRVYTLPRHHAVRLHELLVPDDVKDIFVSLEGNRVSIDAREEDQETIARLVDILKRGDREENRAPRRNVQR